ncbi:MAG: EF-hand domain-containing protein, partial [Pirellulaceae bacterium]
KAPEGYGLQNAVVDINFNANQYKLHDVIANQQDSSVRYSLTNVDSTSVPGRVTVSLSNPLGNTGDDNFALLGRVRLMSIMEVANDTSDGYIQPTSSQAISLGSVDSTIQVLGGSTSILGNGVGIGSTSLTVWPVMYDADDDGRIGLSDFTQFISAYGQPAVTAPGYKFDFDKSGNVGLSDFLLLIQNYGQQRGQVNTRTYHSSFPSSFLEGEPMLLEGEPMISESSLLEGEPYFFEASTAASTSANERFSVDTSPVVSVESQPPVVVQYVSDIHSSESSVDFDLSNHSDPATEAVWDLAEEPATIEIQSESDELIQSVAVPPRADTINQETDELFEDFDESLALDW